VSGHRLETLGGAALAELAAKNTAREKALAASRGATRTAANAIRAVHRGDHDMAAHLLDEAAQALADAEAACADHPAVEHAGFLFDARKEYAEAHTTAAIVARQPLPGADELGLDAAAWLNGLAETVGELRRQALDQLRTDALDRADALLGAMEDIYGLLVTVDYPEGVTGGLRRATDAARGIIERTRGDVATAHGQARLRVALDAHRRDVLGG
jgi:translin